MKKHPFDSAQNWCDRASENLKMFALLATFWKTETLSSQFCKPVLMHSQEKPVNENIQATRHDAEAGRHGERAKVCTETHSPI
jgi:hypothetical protein